VFLITVPLDGNHCKCVHTSIKRVDCCNPTFECSDVLSILGKSTVVEHNVEAENRRNFKYTMVLTETQAACDLSMEGGR
jgi:hypothetical protein